MSLNAQTAFQPFRVDMGSGWNKAFWCNTGDGIALQIEPKYAVIPELNVGLKLEGDLNERNNTYTIDQIKQKAKIIQEIVSGLATTDYYFKPHENSRPFVGAGLGIYYVDGYCDALPIATGKTTNFGTMLRVGIDSNHLRLMLSYNYLGKDKDGYDLSFFSLTLVGYIGGGKKE